METVTKEKAAKIFIENDIISAVFSKPVKKENSEQKVKIRKIILKNEKQYQIESFKDTKVFHKNILPENLLEAVEELFLNFKNAECFSTKKELLFLQNNKGIIRFKEKQINSTDNLNIKRILLNTNTEHNKQKEYILPVNKMPLFLKKLNFFTDEGKIIQSKYHKFRQINKYLEFIKSILPELKSILKEKKELKIIDFGCGKAYLSFALYYYLTEIENLPVNICGLDLKEDVIEFCNKLSRECGFTKLYFKTGNIGSFNFENQPDMIISLHACDTATDLALAKAIKSNTKIIFAVPCCQHEINTQLRNNKNKINSSLSAMTDYGIITEKFASLLTDTIRGKLLESKGYKVSLEEFIDTEHTPKNILIKAIRYNENSKEKEENEKKAIQDFQNIKETFLIEHSLEKLLNKHL